MCHCDDVNVKLCYAFICSDYYICGCRFYIRGGDGQMMTDQHMLIIIILCGIVTILVRVIPFMMISRVNLPDVLIRWLSFIPITLFTALVLDGLIQQHDGSVGYTLNVPFIIALIPTILLAIYTRNLTWTILGGIAFIALLRFFL